MNMNTSLYIEILLQHSLMINSNSIKQFLLYTYTYI